MVSSIIGVCLFGVQRRRHYGVSGRVGCEIDGKQRVIHLARISIGNVVSQPRVAGSGDASGSSWSATVDVI
jgi:hypothetical protein